MGNLCCSRDDARKNVSISLSLTIFVFVKIIFGELGYNASLRVVVSTPALCSLFLTQMNLLCTHIRLPTQNDTEIDYLRTTAMVRIIVNRKPFYSFISSSSTLPDRPGFPNLPRLRFFISHLVLLIPA